MKSVKKIAVIYIRCSTASQMEDLSLQTQEKLCRQKAEAEGYQVIKPIIIGHGMGSFKENSISVNLVRQLIEEGSISAIVALSSDRLFRNVLAYSELTTPANEKGIRLLYVHQSHTIDTVLAVNQLYPDQI